jgi:hypothetical protein
MKTMFGVFRQRALGIASGIAALMMTSGCATVFNGTSQEIGIASSPTGAAVTIDGVSYGSTPAIADLKRKNNHLVRVELTGYQPYETTLTKKVSGWVWGNILIGGLIGLAIDAISGGLYKLTPDQLTAALQREPGAPSAAPSARLGPESSTIYVLAVLQPDPSWTKIAQLEQAN